MLIPCSRAQVVVADPGIRLDRHTPGFMVWDEHGGTFVLRVDELAATEVPAGQSETGIILEIPVVPPGGTHSQPGRVRRPAATPSVPALGPGTAGGGRSGGLSPAGAEPVRLCRRAAPGGQKTRGDRGTRGEGHFKARRVPCQETDLVIHLTKAAMARLVALVLSLARAGG